MDISKITVEKEKSDCDIYDEDVYDISIKFYINENIKVFSLKFKSLSLHNGRKKSIIPTDFDEEWSMNLTKEDSSAFEILKYCKESDDDNDDSSYYVSFQLIHEGNDDLYSNLIMKHSVHIDNMLVELKNIYELVIESHKNYDNNHDESSDDDSSDDSSDESIDDCSNEDSDNCSDCNSDDDN